MTLNKFKQFLLNVLPKLELNYNKSWRQYRADFGEEDSHFRWLGELEYGE